MSESYPGLICVTVFLGALLSPSMGDCASWEVGTSYSLDVVDKAPGEWVYFGKGVSFGIVGIPIPTIQLGVYTSYGRYRYERQGVFCPHGPYSCRSYTDTRSQGAVDLGIVFRAVPPPETQRVREFLFISYAARITDVQDWREGFYNTAELTVGFGGMIRLGDGTRLLLQGGPAFGRKQSVASLPISVMVQFGSP